MLNSLDSSQVRKMKRTGFLSSTLTILLAYLSFVGSAHAIVVVEGPDFPESIPGPADEILLTPGLNFVSGNSSHSGGVDPTVDLDDFILTVPVGYLLESMKFSWTANVGSDVQSLQTSYTLAGTTPSSRTVTLFSDSGGADSSPLINMFDLPLGAGSYLLNQLSISIIGDTVAAAGDFDYTWKFKVAPVPLPPAAWLLISGLLGMAGLSRRRREV